MMTCIQIPRNIKCAEIFCHVDGQRKEPVYSMECFFCNSVFVKLQQFIEHMAKSHKSLVEYLDETKKASQPLLRSAKTGAALVMQTSASVNVNSTEEPEESKYLIEELEMKCEPDLYDVDTDPLNATVSIKSNAFIDCEVKQIHDGTNDCDEYIENVALDYKMINGVDAVEEEDDDTAEDEFDAGEDDDDDNDTVINEVEVNDNSTDTTKVAKAVNKALELLREPNEIMVGIAEEYKKRHLLWDANHRDFKNRKLRLASLTKLTKQVNKRFKLKWSEVQVQYCVKHLRLKYRREITRKEVAASQGKTYQLAWYCEHVSYLQQFIQYKPRIERGTRKFVKEKSPLPIPNLTDTQTIQLIKLYENYPCLWDATSVGYRFTDERQTATEKLLKQAKSKMGSPELSEDELKRILQRIRYACTLEKQRQQQCERDHSEYIPQCRFYEHIRFLQPNVGPFVCEYCQRVMNSVDRYKIHKAQHEGTKPFPCPICNYGFYKTGNYTVHLRRHTDNLPNNCPECGKRFATSSEMGVHRRIHTGERPYVCEECGQTFRLWSFFDRHQRKHQRRPKYNCKYCDKKFYHEGQYYAHTKAHLNVRDKVCSECGKGFTCTKYLRQHKKIHSEVKEYVCKICGKAFSQYAGLSGHMKSHGTTMNGNVGVQFCKD